LVALQGALQRLRGEGVADGRNRNVILKVDQGRRLFEALLVDSLCEVRKIQQVHVSLHDGPRREGVVHEQKNHNVLDPWSVEGLQGLEGAHGKGCLHDVTILSGNKEGGRDAHGIMEDSEIIGLKEDNGESLLPGPMRVSGRIDTNSEPLLGSVANRLDRLEGWLISLPRLLPLEEAG
jgi:hypothetical protein